MSYLTDDSLDHQQCLHLCRQLVDLVSGGSDQISELAAELKKRYEKEVEESRTLRSQTVLVDFVMRRLAILELCVGGLVAGQMDGQDGGLYRENREASEADGTDRV